MRLTFVQYGGDYREAWERFESGGKATYQAQRYSVNFVGSLANRSGQVSVICGATDIAYDVVLPNKVRAIGAGLGQRLRPADLVPIVRNTNPDLLILVTPLIPILRWARANQVRTLATLADSFDSGGFRNRLHYRRLARELNHPSVEWIGNHGIGACLSLVKIGVRKDKIVPWDWPPSHRPSDYAPRRRERIEPLRLAYVGTVSEAKGVGDLIQALALLRDEELFPSLTIVGSESDASMRKLASELGVQDRVHFSGLVANEDIPAVMRAVDAVVIPSRHEYPEGLPLTIYEALSARTPILASDHPMFRGALIQEESALIFPAADPQALALAIRRIGVDSNLYATLSANSEMAWNALQLPVIWGEFIEKWLSNTQADCDWLAEHCLSSGLYEAQIQLRSMKS